MSLRLKIIQRACAGKLSDESNEQKELARQFERLLSVFPSIKDGKVETFILDMLSRSQQSIDNDPGGFLVLLERLVKFTKITKDHSLEELLSCTGTRSLKDLYEKFESIVEGCDGLDSINELARELDTTRNAAPVSKIQVPEPHVFLKDLLFLDQWLERDGFAPTIDDLLNKFLSIIKLSPHLLDISRKATLEEERLFKEAKGLDELDPEARDRWMRQFQSRKNIDESLEGILGLVTGDQARLLCLGILHLVAGIRDISIEIAEKEARLDHIDALLRNPRLYALSLQEMPSEDAIAEQRARLVDDISKLLECREKLCEELAHSSNFDELKGKLTALDKFVTNSIIGSLNALIVRIGATRLRELVVPADVYQGARRAGIRLETIIKVAESKIRDIDFFWDKHVKAKKEKDRLAGKIISELSKRVLEENTVSSGSFIQDAFSIIQSFKMEIEGGDTRENPVIACIFHDAELDLLSSIKEGLEDLDVLASISSLPENVVTNLLKNLDLDSKAKVKKKFFKELLAKYQENRIGLGQDSGDNVDMGIIKNLLRCTPLTRKVYEDEDVKRLLVGLKIQAQFIGLVRGAIRAYDEIARLLEELDPFLLRRFVAIPVPSSPGSFIPQLDEWYELNLGRLHSAGGRDKVNDAIEKVEKLKHLINEIDNLMSEFPPRIKNKLATYPIAE